MSQVSPIFALRLGLPNTGTRHALPRSIDITPLAQAARVCWSRQWSITISFCTLQFAILSYNARGRMVCKCPFVKRDYLYTLLIFIPILYVSWKLLKYLHFTSYSALVLTNSFSVNLSNCLIKPFLKNILRKIKISENYFEFLLLIFCTLYKFFTNSLQNKV